MQKTVAARPLPPYADAHERLGFPPIAFFAKETKRKFYFLDARGRCTSFTSQPPVAINRRKTRKKWERARAREWRLLINKGDDNDTFIHLFLQDRCRVVFPSLDQRFDSRGDKCSCGFEMKDGKHTQAIVTKKLIFKKSKEKKSSLFGDFV